MAKRVPGQITEKELAALPEYTRKAIAAAEEKSRKSAKEEPINDKESLGSEIKSSIIPRLESVSKLEQIQQPGPSVEAQSQSETGKKGVLDNILNYSKVSSDNSTQLVSLTKEIKTLNEKSIEDNKELFERLLKSNDALKTSMEENMRESARAKGAGGGTAGAGPSEGGGGGDKGGGLPDWFKTAAGVAAGGIGAKVLGGAAKRFGGEAAAKGMAGLKGFGKGALKAGGLGALGLLGYTMSSEDLKEKLGAFGIDENAIGAAGVAGTLGYGAYKAKQGMDAAGKIIAENKPTVEKPEGKPASKSEAPKIEPKTEAPKVEPKAEVPKTDPTKGAAEAAKNNIAKEAGEATTEKVGKTAGKEAVKKALSSSSKKIASSAIKKIPFIGAIAGLGLAIDRAFGGDYKGAIGEVTSGIIGGTGVGAVGSLAIDAGLLARDIYKELYGSFPEDDEQEVRSSRMGEIQSEVTEYVKSLLPQRDESKTEEMKPLDELSGQQNEPPPSPQQEQPKKGMVERGLEAAGVDTRGLGDAKEGEIMPDAYVTSSSTLDKSSIKGNIETVTQNPENYDAMGNSIGPTYDVSEKQVDENKSRLGKYISDTKAVAGSTLLGSMLTREGGQSERFIGSVSSTENGERQSQRMSGRRISGGMFGFDKFEITSGNEKTEVNRGEYAGIQKLLSEGKQEEAFQTLQKIRNAKNQMPEYDAAGNVVGVNPEGKLDAVKSMETKAGALSQAPSQQSSAPIVVKGGDTINNITNTSGGGSGGAPGTPSRVPNPWDNQVFGQPWAAYP